VEPHATSTLGIKIAFSLECQALKTVREGMAFINVIPIMILFCKAVEEGIILEEIGSCGLSRGKNGLWVYIMCEIPNNVVLVGDFCQLMNRLCP
jgi:pyruvate,water dikinase